MHDRIFKGVFDDEAFTPVRTWRVGCVEQLLSICICQTATFLGEQAGVEELGRRCHFGAFGASWSFELHYKCQVGLFERPCTVGLK